MCLDTLLQVAVDVTRELFEEDSEEIGKKWTSEIETLLSKVITVIELATAKGSGTQSVNHVSQEVCLLGLETLGDGYVRQHLLLKDIESSTLTLCPGALLLLSTTTDKVQSSVAVLNRKCLFDTRSEHLQHGRVVLVETDVLQHVSVWDDTKRTEDDDDRNVDLGIWQRRADDRPSGRPLRCTSVHPHDRL